MLFWTLFTACNPEAKSSDPVAETDPVAGSIRLLFTRRCSTIDGNGRTKFLTGNLVDIRDGSGDCTAELVFQTEDAEHVIGYSILDPEGNDATFIPDWTSAENITLSTHISFVFGMAYGLVLEDDNGIMMALDEGTWGGALKDAELPFEVGQSDNEVGFIEEECMTKTGFALTIGDEELAPFGEFDIGIDGQDFTFVSVSAIQYGPGQAVRSLI